jgi:hypothetical protein
MVVHVNRLKKFNKRENKPTLTTPNSQQPKELNTETKKTEEKHTSITPTTTVRRGRGRPRKNVPQAAEKIPDNQCTR